MIKPRLVGATCKAAVVYGVVVLGLLLISGPGPGGEALAQALKLCAQPRAFCATSIPTHCAEQASKEASGAAVKAGPNCAEAAKAYRSCLREAADCPGVVDQSTPKAPRETNLECPHGVCAERPDKPEIRDAANDPEQPKEPR